MNAYKFLHRGRVGPFSGVTWPPPGSWLAAIPGDRDPCRDGVHACSVEQLPLWIAEELWAVELHDPVLEMPAKVVGVAGQLVARVEAWDADAAHAFIDETIARCDAAGYAEDLRAYCIDSPDPFRAAALSTLIANRGAHAAGGDAAVHAERAAEVAFFERLLAVPGRRAVPGGTTTGSCMVGGVRALRID